MNKTDMTAYGLRGQYEMPTDGCKIGRILSQEKGMYFLISENGEQIAEVSGKFRNSAKEASDFPVVGDFVLADCEDTHNHAVIHEILPRKTVFSRKAAGKNTGKQIVAANIDTVFICMSLNNDFNLRRLDRYLSAAWDSGAVPVIVLTKSDLCPNIESFKNQVSEAAFGTDIITTTNDDDSYKKLLQYIDTGKTAALIGSSGVGKSTLINRLLGEERLETNGLRNDDKGRHTTTRRELFLQSGGGMIIDTPGMRELGLWNAEKGIDKSFSDIEILAKQCKFSDCTHQSEPSCAVRNAIANGSLSKERFLSYQKLKAENAYFENTNEYLEQKKKKFKNIAKINKEQRK